MIRVKLIKINSIITVIVIFLALAGTLAHDMFYHHHHDGEEQKREHSTIGIVFEHNDGHSHTSLFEHDHMTGVFHKPYFNNRILPLSISVFLLSLVLLIYPILQARKFQLRKEKPDRVSPTYRPMLI